MSQTIANTLKISVEISLYPLDDNFLSIIQDIVKKLNGVESIECRTNCMSTQLFGEFDAVMKALSETLRYSFETYGRQVFVTKFVKGDLFGSLADDAPVSE